MIVVVEDVAVVTEGVAVVEDFAVIGDAAVVIEDVVLGYSDPLDESMMKNARGVVTWLQSDSEQDSTMLHRLVAVYQKQAGTSEKKTLYLWKGRAQDSQS